MEKKIRNIMVELKKLGYKPSYEEAEDFDVDDNINVVSKNDIDLHIQVCMDNTFSVNVVYENTKKNLIEESVDNLKTVSQVIKTVKQVAKKFKTHLSC